MIEVFYSKEFPDSLLYQKPNVFKWIYGDDREDDWEYDSGAPLTPKDKEYVKILEFKE